MSFSWPTIYTRWGHQKGANFPLSVLFIFPGPRPFPEQGCDTKIVSIIFSYFRKMVFRLCHRRGRVLEVVQLSGKKLVITGKIKQAVAGKIE